AFRDPRAVLDVEAVLRGEVDFVQLQAALGCERARVRARLVGVFADPEPEIEAVGFVSEVAEELPQTERVLAAGDRNEHALTGADHVELLHCPTHLLAAVANEAVAAIAGVVPPDVDHRRGAAPSALHRGLTGRRPTSPAGSRPRRRPKGARRAWRACRCG